MSEGLPGRSTTTIREVAQLAGVSVSTVSRVLSDHPDVHPGTRDRVREVIDRLQFRPSALARGLILGRARILGLLVSDVTNPFYPELLRAIESTAREQGYTIILCSTEDDREQAATSIRVLQEYQVEGVIHASVCLGDPILDWLGSPASRPVVFVNRTAETDRASSVTVDNRAGAILATQHLLDLGRKNLMHLAGPTWASNAVARQAGFQQAVDDANVPARVVEVGFLVEAAQERIEEALSQGPPPDGIFAVNDSIAIAAMEVMARRGLRIPQDVAVVGFDDTHLSASRFIQLTTVAHNVREVGELATRMMISRLEGQVEAWPQHVVLPPRLVVRGSTAQKEETA